MKNVNLIFRVKAISLVANSGSTRSASTSVNHKQRIEKSNFLAPPPPPLALTSQQTASNLFFWKRNCFSNIFIKS